MDHETKKKYCSLLMFELPSTPVSPATPTSPSVLQATGEPSFGYSPSEACTPPSPPSSSDDDLFIYEKGDGSFTPVLESKASPRQRAPTLSIVTTPLYAVDGTVTGTAAAKDPPAVSKKPAGQQEQRTPRPPNAFILYRRAVQPSIIARYRNISNAEISKQLSHMWRNEPESVKLQWQREADRKKMEHAEAHPDYVYRPKKKTDAKAKKRRVRGVQQQKAYDTAPSYPYFPPLPLPDMMANSIMMLPSPPLTNAGSPITPSLWSPPTTPGGGVTYFWPDHLSTVQHDTSSPCGNDNGGWDACGNPPTIEMYTGSFSGHPQDNPYMVHIGYNYLGDSTNDPSQHRQQTDQHDQQNQSHYQPHHSPIDRTFEELFGVPALEDLLCEDFLL